MLKIIVVRNDPRQGVVLLVVIAMLALFATVALSFVFYAESAATMSRYASQAQNQAQADVDPELLLSYFLSQFIYDTDNVYSAMRGHSLARTMYGANPNQLNMIPFNGTGRLRELIAPPPAGLPNNINMVNYQFYPTDKFIRYPEVHGTLISDNSPLLLTNTTNGANVPWTYPDLHNMFLAAVNANGEVLIPSFQRPWTLIPGPAKWQKYETLRPHKSWHNLFASPDNDNPPNPDMGCDVKNLDNSPGRFLASNKYANNDSIWMDLAFPILTAPNGMKYKAMFAPLIVDLDNRLNLGVHGNIKGPGNKHTSHQGFGRWEVNLSKVLPGYVNLFVNANTSLSPRYGTLGTPGPNPPTPPTPPILPPPLISAPWYAQVNIDGLIGGVGGPLTLPTAGVYSPFPTYPGLWFDPATELTNHPAAYRYFNNPPVPNNNPPLPLSNQEALMRYGATGSPGLTSTLLQSLSTDLKALSANNVLARRRAHQITLLSMDLNRPGVTPYLFQPPGTVGPAPNGSTNYSFIAPGPPAPGSGAYPFMQTPVKSPSPTTVPTGGDFGQDWRSTIAFLKNRIDINKVLPSYSGPPPFTAAEQARATPPGSSPPGLANSIYYMLIQLTGAKDPNVTPVAPGSPEYHAARWLAQVAVNIVDYVDEDDVMTGFNWFAGDYVYGTELPRLVVNEVHCQIHNDNADPGINTVTFPVPATRNATKYNLNFWVELHNPFKITPPGANFPSNGGKAILSKNGPGQSIYRLLITKANTTLGDDHPENFKGGADTANTPEMSVVDDFPAYTGAGSPASSFVDPAGTAFSDPSKTNQGFYLLGPSTTFLASPPHPTNHDPGFPPSTFASSKMTISYPVATVPTPPYDILLQRLANPDLPFAAATNPFVTVDYVQGIIPEDSRDYNPNLATPTLFASMATIGRKQPYSANWAKQTLSPPNQPKNTFFQHNAPLDSPFTWLAHLDRPLVNALELLQVSGYAPHRLTQKFIPNAGAMFSHRAFWEDQNTLVYRLLEMIEPREYMDGLPSSARTPGKININTVWDVLKKDQDIEIWNALCDRQAWNKFTNANVAILFDNLMKSRTPAGTPGPNDIPFTSLGAGSLPVGDVQFPSGHGMNYSSVLRSTAATATSPTPTRLGWVPGAAHPYLQYELLSKIYNNITTRSNCFAMWLTVGFFEVDDTVVPAKIKGEIGRDENRQIRHRMFAIIDRTNLMMPLPPPPQVPPPPGTPITFSTTTASASALNKVSVVPLPPFPPPGVPIPGVKVYYNIRPGMKLTIDTGVNQEAVEVYSVDNYKNEVTIKGAFAKPHAAGVPVQLPGTVPTDPTTGTPCITPFGGGALGNPGPQEGLFDPRQNTLVVPYFSIIQ